MESSLCNKTMFNTLKSATTTEKLVQKKLALKIFHVCVKKIESESLKVVKKIFSFRSEL